MIITKDDAGSSWGVNAYLSRRFKDQVPNKSHKGIKVTPLVTLSISSLERLMWKLKEISFADLLQERIQRNPDLRWPFDAGCSYAEKGTPRGLGAHIEAYKELSEKLIADFGVTDEVAPAQASQNTHG